MVASDRMSAFDVVMNEPVPDKGRVLTAMSAFWFEQLRDIAPSHLISTSSADFPDGARGPELEGRSMLCRVADMLPIECIVRGYLAGSAWKEYTATGSTHGLELPAGLRESCQLPEPVFTPSTKAALGHDENISFERAVALVVPPRSNAPATSRSRVHASRRVASSGHHHRRHQVRVVHRRSSRVQKSSLPIRRGFGRLINASGYRPPSVDNARADYLDGLAWNKQPPPPPLPPEVVAATRSRYIDAYELITGRSFADWPGVSR